jgi:hypothetical protein
MDIKNVATIRKWVGERGWGIANSYDKHGVIQKVFVHVSNVVSGEPKLGARIWFVQGPPRSEYDLPVALQIEVVEGVQR